MASFSEYTEVPLGGDSQVGSVVGGVVRRAVSLDSVRPPGSGSGKKRHPDEDGYHRHSRVGASCEAGGSRSPSPTASSGIESGSIKDSPMQIADVLTADSSSIDTQDDPQSFGGSSSSMVLHCYKLLIEHSPFMYKCQE